MTDKGTFREIQGWWEDQRFHSECVARVGDGAHFVEIGAWRGRSAASMAEVIRDFGKVIRFDSVDTWEGTPRESDGGTHQALIAEERIDLRSEFEANLRRLNLWKYVNPVIGDSVEAAQQYENQSLDLVFIDADHRTEMVARDIQAWLPKIAPGGRLAGHDWTNEAVQRAVVANVSEIGTPQYKGMVWWIDLPVQEVKVAKVTMPPYYPGALAHHDHLAFGFGQAGCELTLDYALLEMGHWSPPGRAKKEPIHIAPILINETSVWYDFADFTEEWSEALGDNLCFKVQARQKDVDAGRVLPAGQYLSKPETYLTARDNLDATPPSGDSNGIARFSNIDELHNQPLRRQLVTALRKHKRMIIGLWRFNKHRPEVPAVLAAHPAPFEQHLGQLRRAKLAFAMPGVAGDFTRQHAEIMGLGTCLVTVKTEQAWPGNWRGCWAEMKRDLSDLGETVERLLGDEQERERLARLGRWYFERNLTPESMARRFLNTVERANNGDHN